MDNVLLYIHSYLRWIILVLLITSIFKSYFAWQKKKVFTPADRKLWLFTMISAHIMLLVGLYQWLFGRFGALTVTLPPGVKVMKDAFYRFFWIEHPTAMIIAIILITLGNGMAKKSVADEVKFKKAFWFFFIALLLILAAIPWPFREIGRPLFRG